MLSARSTSSDLKREREKINQYSKTKKDTVFNSKDAGVRTEGDAA